MSRPIEPPQTGSSVIGRCRLYVVSAVPPPCGTMKGMGLSLALAMGTWGWAWGSQWEALMAGKRSEVGACDSLYEHFCAGHAVFSETPLRRLIRDGMATRSIFLIPADLR